MKRILLLVIAILLPQIVVSQPPPPVDQIVQVSAEIFDKNILALEWQIAPGYFLYKDRFQFEVVKPKEVELEQPIMPPGSPKEDDLIGKYDVYYGEVTVNLLFFQTFDNNIILKVGYQACSDSGYCYPPEKRYYQINFGYETLAPYQMPVAKEGPITELGKISKILNTERVLIILLWFIGFGLLLSFTPCVLPMIPILSSIIAGHENITTGKAFRLSLVYVLSMSLTYALAGVLIGYMGGSAQVALQKPWVIVIFSIAFVLLALSLFGFYELRLPNRFEAFISNKSRELKGGHYLSVFVMGTLATLIVSPCITPPLFAALAYIGQTGDALVGGLSLFAMGLGMGVPLLLIGTAAGKFVPKAGAWMNVVKSIFGVMLLMVAIYMLDRVLPGPVILALWGSLFIITAIFMGALSATKETVIHKFTKGLGIISLVYGILLLIGAALGNHDPLNPLQRLTGHEVEVTTAPQKDTPVIKIKSLADLNRALKIAKQDNKPAMLDFYADWCVACKQMEYRTFADPKVKPVLADDFLFIQADVTQNDAVDKKLMQHFGVIAPPSIVFFNAEGNELNDYRIVGEMGPKDFLELLNKVLSQANVQ